MATLVLVDDHALLRNGLASLLKSLGHVILFESDNGKMFTESMKSSPAPDIVLLDINMPEMDGYQTCKWLKENHPDVKVLALSMYDNETAIIGMLRSGAKGYILKDSDPEELKTAIHDLMTKGFYYSDLVNGKLLHVINQLEEGNHLMQPSFNLSDRERDFLRHTCSELTYKEIAALMFVSPRTIDGYRDALFEKLQIKTRVGLAIYAIRNGLVDIG